VYRLLILFFLCPFVLADEVGDTEQTGDTPSIEDNPDEFRTWFLTQTGNEVPSPCSGCTYDEVSGEVNIPQGSGHEVTDSNGNVMKAMPGGMTCKKDSGCTYNEATGEGGTYTGQTGDDGIDVEHMTAGVSDEDDTDDLTESNWYGVYNMDNVQHDEPTNTHSGQTGSDTLVISPDTKILLSNNVAEESLWAGNPLGQTFWVPPGEEINFVRGSDVIPYIAPEDGTGGWVQIEPSGVVTALGDVNMGPTSTEFIGVGEQGGHHQLGAHSLRGSNIFWITNSEDTHTFDLGGSEGSSGPDSSVIKSNNFGVFFNSLAKQAEGLPDSNGQQALEDRFGYPHDVYGYPNTAEVHEDASDVVNQAAGALVKHHANEMMIGLMGSFKNYITESVGTESLDTQAISGETEAKIKAGHDLNEIESGWGTTSFEFKVGPLVDGTVIDSFEVNHVGDSYSLGVHGNQDRQGISGEKKFNSQKFGNGQFGATVYTTEEYNAYINAITDNQINWNLDVELKKPEADEDVNDIDGGFAYPEKPESSAPTFRMDLSKNNGDIGAEVSGYYGLDKSGGGQVQVWRDLGKGWHITGGINYDEWRDAEGRQQEYRGVVSLTWGLNGKKVTKELKKR